MSNANRPEQIVKSNLFAALGDNPNIGGRKFKVWTMGTRFFLEDPSNGEFYDVAVTIPMASTVEKVKNPPAPKPTKESKPKAATASKSKAPAPAKEIKPSTARARARKQQADEIAAEAAANAA